MKFLARVGCVPAATIFSFWPGPAARWWVQGKVAESAEVASPRHATTGTTHSICSGRFTIGQRAGHREERYPNEKNTTQCHAKESGNRTIWFSRYLFDPSSLSTQNLQHSTTINTPISLQTIQ